MNDKQKVLVVDDSSVAVRQLEEIINGLTGFEVAGHAHDGIEAIQKYDELSPDIVLMDVLMPRLNGLEAIRSILSRDPDAKIVVISSVGGARETVVEAIRFGAKCVVAKPFEPIDIQAVLESL